MNMDVLLQIKISYNILRDNKDKCFIFRDLRVVYNYSVNCCRIIKSNYYYINIDLIDSKLTRDIYEYSG